MPAWHRGKRARRKWRRKKTAPSPARAVAVAHAAGNVQRSSRLPSAFTPIDWPVQALVHWLRAGSYGTLALIVAPARIVAGFNVLRRTITPSCRPGGGNVCWICRDLCAAVHRASRRPIWNLQLGGGRKVYHCGRCARESIRVLAEVAAVRELLRQRAIAVGLLAAETGDEGAIGAAIERLLANEVDVPTPTEAECRRHYNTHLKEFTNGDLVHVRHILFQITPSVSVPEIRARAERALSELVADPDRFAALAAELSNCPSGQHGGNLGQIGRGDTVPEFERAIFRLGANGILRELVKTRHGFHIVAVDASIPGKTLPFDAVEERIAARLRAAVEERALRQYVSILAGRAEISGADVAGAKTPLVQ
jgi:peptidyl-prolyl cis-trans isomerase C